MRSVLVKFCTRTKAAQRILGFQLIQTGLSRLSFKHFTVGSTHETTNAVLEIAILCGWAWDAGSSTVSNTDGSQTTSVQRQCYRWIFNRRGYKYDFSRKCSNFGHGLNAAPELIM